MKPRYRPAGRTSVSQKWAMCDRCGLYWPLSTLRKQEGALVCPEDFDAPGHKQTMKERGPEPEGKVESPWPED